MSAGFVFKPESPWHPTHKLTGHFQSHRMGPSGNQRCVKCGARRWVNYSEFSETCGGSVEHDTAAERQCKESSWKCLAAKAVGKTL